MRKKEILALMTFIVKFYPVLKDHISHTSFANVTKRSILCLSRWIKDELVSAMGGNAR
jgi:hypothetical protein